MADHGELDGVLGGAIGAQANSSFDDAPLLEDASAAEQLDLTGPGVVGVGGLFGLTSITVYLMRAWNTVTETYEPWISVGSPSLTPPSGQTVTGISARPVRPKDLVRVP